MEPLRPSFAEKKRHRPVSSRPSSSPKTAAQRGGPPFVEAVKVSVLEHIADPHLDPFARTRFTQAPRELGDEPLPLLHFGQVGRGISPVIYCADAQPRLAIHLARRSRLASGRFRRSPELLTMRRTYQLIRQYKIRLVAVGVRPVQMINVASMTCEAENRPVMPPSAHATPIGRCWRSGPAARA